MGDNKHENKFHDTMLVNIKLMLQILVNTVEQLKPVDERAHLIAKVNLDQTIAALEKAYKKNIEN